LRQLKRISQWNFKGIFYKTQAYYKTLDKLPIWNFKKVEITGNVKYLLNLNSYDELPKLSPKLETKLYTVWDLMDLEYLEKVGINKDYERYLKDKKRLLVLELDTCMQNDRMKHTILKAHKHKFQEKYKGSVDNTPFMEQVANLENYFNSINSIDVYKMSCTKYFTYVKIMQAELKAKKSANNG
jgi:hypothetical protein